MSKSKRSKNKNHSVDLNGASIDYETRSQVDLKQVGTVAYARHPSTIVLYAVLHWRGKKYLFNPASNRKEIKKIMWALFHSGEQIAAYNWTFEYNITKYVANRLYDWPVIPANQWTCTMALALRYGLGGKLEDDAEYLGVVPKDAEGHRVMLRLTKPRPPRKNENPEYTYFDNDKQKHHVTQLYNMRDVVTETGVKNKCPPLSKLEEKIFRLDQAMNLHGVRVDVELCHGALQAFEKYQAHLVSRIPKGADKFFSALSQREKVKNYLEHIGVPLENMQADNLLKELRTCTNKKAKRVMVAYVEAQGSSIAKYNTALNHQYNGRLYHNLQYCGASNTGRWAGRGVQLQNVFRPVVKYDVKAVEIIKTGSFKAIAEYASSIKTVNDKRATVSDILKSYMRSFLIADEGALIAVNDYAAIEARLVFWLSGCVAGIKLYREGEDTYKYLASVIYDKKVKRVTSGERFVGKQGILGLGYGMGESRFIEQCAGYDVVISYGLAAKTKKAYRTRFKEVVDYWHLLENTVLHILQLGIKDKWVEAGPVMYRQHNGNIECRLPSGGTLYYHGMRIGSDDKLVYYTTPRMGGKKMMLRSIWGGTLLENISQATARELMSAAMLKLEAHNFKNQLTVHDELLNRAARADQLTEIQQIILDKPKWARGLPLEVEGEVLDRYRKV